MSDQKSYNVDPYFDDFDANKNFHQILFKPGFSVQGRELTQLQTILRDQIKKFGDHIFQQGSLVIPGNSFYELTVPFVRLENNFGGSSIDVSQFLNKTVVGAVSGVEGIVRAVSPLDATDPNTIYLNYTRAGINGESLFLDSEEIYTKENIGIRATVAPVTPFGNGSIAFINDGVYYVNGTFVKVLKQSVIISKYDSTPSCSVLLKINESIVTSDEDQSLLDPAQGSYNYAAPGADRVKIELELVRLDLNSPIDEDFVEILRFENGVLMYHAKTPKYSELEKSLARRTYDESGDYVVNGLQSDIEEHIKLPKTRGKFPPPIGNKNKFVLTLQPGKAYIRGFEKEILNETVLSLDKARTLDHIRNKQSSVNIKYGQIIYVSNLVRLPDFFNHQLITFYNDDDPSLGSATAVGTARAYALEYVEGQQIYSMYIYDVNFSGTYSIQDVGGLRFTGPGSATVLHKCEVPNATGNYLPGETVSFSGRTATVRYHNQATSSVYLYKHQSTAQMLLVGDSVVGSTSNATGVMTDKRSIEARGPYESPIIPVPLSPTASIRNENGVSDISYKVYKFLEINTDANGDGSVTLDFGRIDSLTSSTLMASWSNGQLALNLFDLESDGTTLTIEGGPANSNIKIQAVVSKSGINEKTKTLTTTVDSGLLLTGSGQRYAQLTKADIYDIVSIVSSTDGTVTDRFRLDNGQRNYFYGMGRALLNGAAPGGTLTITYRYFEHSSTGDYFSVDSYRNSGIADPNDLDFLSYIPQYYSTTSSHYFDLKQSYDFRKIIGQVGDAPMNTSRISASIDYYVGRIDLYGIDKSGEIVYVRGIPEEVPSAPKIPNDALLLGSFAVPAWTENIKSIKVKEEKVRRFTMQDINQLSDRLSNLENYTTLTQEESDLLNMEIVDAKTGLTRFKSGYLVDNFTNPNLIADKFNPVFAAEYDSKLLFPAKEWVQAPFDFHALGSTNFQVTGDIVTLPYTEVTFVRQPFSTKITNVNPFLVVSWKGSMTLSPSFDSWIETEDLPTILHTINQVVTVTRQEIVPVPVIYFGPPGTPPPTTVPAPPPVPGPTPPVIVSRSTTIASQPPRAPGVTSTNFGSVPNLT